MKRNDLEVTADILRVAKGGAKKTHIVYQANLNFRMAKKYLDRLMERGLIEQINGRFFTTKDGESFIRRLSGLQGLA